MSLPRHARYRDSGVEWLGQVPEHWPVLRLKHACRVFPSNVDKKSVEGEEHVHLCNYTDVYYHDRIVSGMDFMAATATHDQVAKFTLRAGDTVITKDSETADDIAVSAFVPADLPGVVCGYHLSVVRPLAGTNGAYVKRLFDSTFAKCCFEVRANGLTRVGLGQYALDNVTLPFPPPAEQAAIAAFLDRETAKIDALVSEQRRLMDLLKEKRQAVISHAVTKGLNPDARMKPSGIEWLGAVPAHWPVVKLRRLIRHIEQGWSPECYARPAGSDEWGVVKAGCVNRGVFVEDENKALPETLQPLPELEIKAGDVVMSRASGSPELVGSTAFVSTTRSRLMLSDKTFRIHVMSTLKPEYFVALLNSRASRIQVERAISGADGLANNLPQSAIKEFVCSVPPIGEQSDILDQLRTTTARVDTLVAEAERAIELLRERRTALISAAVTGQVDVRDLAPEAA